MAWVDKETWQSSGTTRYAGKSQYGEQGNRVLPTSYVMAAGKLSAITSNFADIPNLTPVHNVTAGNTAAYSPAINRSWSKLVDSIRGQTSDLGATLGEGRQGLDMVTNRLMQMYRSYRALRKGDFRKFLRELGIGAKRKHRNLVRNEVNRASSLWLEYSFGWKPLCGDIYNALDALGQPIPGGRCSGSGSYSFDIVGNIKPPPLFNTYRRYTGRYRVRQGAFVYVTNPNLYALQQTGLANPIAVAWELVPFSFLVDWVFDVGTCLGGMTDLVGCTVVGPYTTVSCRGSAEIIVNDGSLKKSSGRFAALKRSKTLSRPMPNFHVLSNIGSSLNRAANAASLLGQLLTK